MTGLELLPGGHYGSATGVNDEGVVVGVSDTADGTSHAVLWREGQITDLGTLGGWTSQATAVNGHGVVVGWSQTPAGAAHPFIWTDGQLSDLCPLGGTSASATAINDHGWVVGNNSTAEGVMHAFVWKAGEMTDLGTIVPGAFQSSHANDIDYEGRIVGGASVDNMNTVPVLWEDGRIRRLTDRYGWATSINSRGQVTGCLPTTPECFVWSHDHLTLISPDESPPALRAQAIARPDRGSISVTVEGIDRHGRVAGWTGHAAFVWHGGKFDWLQGLTKGQSLANDISDNGRFVVGSSATAPDGLTRHPVVRTLPR